jgi:hypothetical protein
MKKQNFDIILSIAAFFPVVLLMLQNIIVDLNFLPYEQTRVINITLSGVVMLFALYPIVKRNLVLFFVSYTIVTLLLLLTLIFYPENYEYLTSGSFYLLLINIPSFLCIASIRDFSILKNVLLKVSYLIFSLGFLYTLLVLIGKIPYSNYNMSFSYHLLLPALIFSSRQKIIYDFLYFLTLSFMLIFGSRGAFIIAFTYFIIINIFYLNKKKYFYLILLYIALTLVLLYFNKISAIIENIFGFAPRTLNFLLENQIFDDTGRYELYRKTWNSILSGSFFGHGLFGDRVLLGDKYTHNIALEILYNFGFLIGGSIVIIMIALIIHLLIKVSQKEKIMLLLFVFYGFIPLFISGSYLIDSKFGIFLGLLYYLNNTKLTQTRQELKNQYVKFPKVVDES